RRLRSPIAVRHRRRGTPMPADATDWPRDCRPRVSLRRFQYENRRRRTPGRNERELAANTAGGDQEHSRFVKGDALLLSARRLWPNRPGRARYKTPHAALNTPAGAKKPHEILPIGGAALGKQPRPPLA